MLELTISIGDDSFYLKTDKPFVEFKETLLLWFSSRDAAQQAKVDALARELERDVDKEAADAVANTPK